MKMNELEIIPLIAYFGSFSETSKKTGISVSALSKMVARAEDELGVALFERKTYRGSVAMTEAGKALIPGISKLVSVNARLVSRLDSLKGINSGTLSVGVTTSLDGSGVPKLLAEYLHRNPDLKLVSIFRPRQEMIRMLTEGVVECVFFLNIGPLDEKEFKGLTKEDYELIPLVTTKKLFIGISEGDPLAERETLCMNDLRYQRFLFNRSHDSKRRSEGRGVSFFEHMGVRERDYDFDFEDFQNSGYVYSLVAKGAGVIPQVFPPRRVIPGVRFIPLEGWTQESGMYMVTGRFGGDRLTDFVKFVRSEVEEYSEKGNED